MRPTFRILLAAAIAGTAALSAARAQQAPVTAAAPQAVPAQAPQDGALPCNDFLCRLFKDPEPAAEAQPVSQPAESARAHRGRHRHAARPSGESVDQTASIDTPGRVTFLAGPDAAHEAVYADLKTVLAPDLAAETERGRGEPVKDLLSLPGIDLAIVSGLSLTEHKDAFDRLVYIAKLFTEELHAVAKSDIARLDDLNGKPVFLGAPGSDSEAAAKAVLDSRGIAVEPVAGSFADALTGLRERRIAAAFVLAPKPFRALADVRAADGLHLLPLAYRSSDAAALYPAAFTPADYPGLVGQGGTVDTVATDAILIAPWWRDSSPRQKELTAFTDRFFDSLGKLDDGSRPKWKDVNLAAAFDGLRRFKPAQQWVAAKLKAKGVAASGRHRVAGETP